MILANLLSSTKYIIVNKDLIKILGLNEAVILGELCSEYSYWESKEQLIDNEYFYSTRENIEENTGINPHYQRMAMKNLENNNIIELKKMGIPCKTYYKINENAVFDLIRNGKNKGESLDVHQVNDKEFTGCTTRQQPGEQLDNHQVNDINNNKINNKINNKEKGEVQKNGDGKKLVAAKVMMAEQEFKNLVNRFGEKKTNELIENLSLYKQSTGKSYYSDYATILKWERDNSKDEKRESSNKIVYKNNANYEQREYPSNFFDNFYVKLRSPPNDE